MKDSGIEWIGMIPVDWNIVRIGNQYTERKTKVSDRDYPPLSVTMKGILPQLASAAKTDAHDDRKLVCKGDFAINSRSDRRGSCGISAYDGSVSLINTILQPRDEMNPQYYDWLFHSPMFSDEFYKWGHGIVDDLWTTNWQDMKRIAIPEPPLEEQQRIADYLSEQCAEIGAVIERTKATIEEYRKLKQAIITNAVTKGIRGVRNMAPTGNVRWGDIPEEWEFRRVKTCVTEVKSGLSAVTEDDSAEESGFYVLRTSAVSTGIFIPCEVKAVLTSAVDRLICPVEKDTLVVSRMNTSAMVGACAYVAEDCPNTFLPDKLWRIRIASGEYAKYLWYAINSVPARSWFSELATGTSASMQNITITDFTSNYIAIPPKEEQIEIVEYLNKKCGDIDALIEKKTALLAELEAYKKAVIFEYVTGKKEIGVAAQSVTTTIVYPYFPAVLSTKKARFAQAVLMSRILDKCRTKMGRVKLEKMLYTIETSVGFDFDTEYVRQAAGPLDDSIYECEGIISRKNKWYTMKTSKYGVSYTPAKDNGKYKKYYDKYFADYDSEIERIIGIFMDYDADQAEIVATLFAAWNDFIIDRKEFTDEQLVDEVLNNWNDSKKRFSRDVWLRAIQQMRQNNIVPKGYGKRTVIKN